MALVDTLIHNILMQHLFEFEKNCKTLLTSYLEDRDRILKKLSMHSAFNSAKGFDFKYPPVFEPTLSFKNLQNFVPVKIVVVHALDTILTSLRLL